MNVHDLRLALYDCDPEAEVWFAAAEKVTALVTEVDSAEQGRVVLYGPED